MTAVAHNATERTTSSDSSAFWRLWAIAAFAHVISNGIALPFAFRSVTNLVVGLVAIAVVVDPRDRRTRTALVASIPVSAFAEAPFLGNHWFLAAMVSVAALAAGPWRGDAEWWRRFAPVARCLLLLFYGFAAFAKVNTGFFDSIESCARFFANQTLGFWQLPEVSGDGAIAAALPWITAAIELSVPVLLLIRRTRPIGVWLAVAFHLVLTLDLQQHFFDFTLTLLPLFLLFARPGTLAELDERLPRSRLAGGHVWIGVAALMVVSAVMPLPMVAKGLTVLVSWALWIGLGFVLLRALVLRLPVDGTAPSLTFRPPSVLGGLVIAVVVLNGLSPYLEIKTAAGFNMYANLVTADGDTNHLIVPGTAALRPDQSELAIIRSTSDEDLAEYIDSGFALPLTSLRDYLADHPDAAVSFDVVVRRGSPIRVDLDRAGDHPEWTEAQPWYAEKFLLFRAVPLGDPPVCQNTFLPAR